MLERYASQSPRRYQACLLPCEKLVLPFKEPILMDSFECCSKVTASFSCWESVKKAEEKQ